MKTLIAVVPWDAAQCLFRNEWSFSVPRDARAYQYTANSADAIKLTDDTGNAADRIGCGVIK